MGRFSDGVISDGLFSILILIEILPITNFKFCPSLKRGCGLFLLLVENSLLFTCRSKSFIVMFLSCTVSGILKICQTLKMSRDPKHMSFGGSLSCLR